jgi:transcriptional/translational regulatory protein YebC/TACO1
VAEVRHAFSKHGGNLGTDGSVAYQFWHCGQLIFAPGTSEDRVMEVALEAGAHDVIRGEDASIEVVCEPGRFEALRKALQAAALQTEVAAIVMKAESEVMLSNENAQRMQKLLDALDQLDDVQEVYTNAVLDL